MSPFTQFFVDNLDLLLKRDYLLEVFTIPDRITCEDGETIHTESPMYQGKLVAYKGRIHTILSFEDQGDHTFTVKLSDLEEKMPTSDPILSFEDTVVLERGMISTYSEDAPLQTTIGRLVWNYVALANPFDDIMPYLNTPWNPGAIEDMIAHALITQTTTMEQQSRYTRNVYYLGHFTELGVVAFTRKSLTTDPNLAKRRNELLKEHAEELASGDAVVMSKIEQELIAMDKEWLKDDPVMMFYRKNEKKIFNIQRKKLFGAGGMTEKFGDKGNFDFVSSSLSEGWDPEDFQVQANEIRAGSFSRAKETAIGGEDIKFILRVFQNSRILEEDCKSDTFLNVVVNKWNYKYYRHRYIKSGSDLKELTENDVEKLIGKTIQVRSPMTCKTDGGYCRVCMGKIFSVLDQKQLDLRANVLGRYFITSSLKGMHGTSFNTFEISNLNDFSF